jgi:hypothetical protein
LVTAKEFESFFGEMGKTNRKIQKEQIPGSKIPTIN